MSVILIFVLITKKRVYTVVSSLFAEHLFYLHAWMQKLDDSL